MTMLWQMKRQIQMTKIVTSLLNFYVYVTTHSHFSFYQYLSCAHYIRVGYLKKIQNDFSKSVLRIIFGKTRYLVFYIAQCCKHVKGNETFLTSFENLFKTLTLRFHVFPPKFKVKNKIKSYKFAILFYSVIYTVRDRFRPMVIVREREFSRSKDYRRSKLVAYCVNY